MKSENRKVEVHSIQKHYRGKLFSFVSEDVTLPNGSRAEIHPGSTAVVPLLDENTVVMERQYRHAVEDYLLEIPAAPCSPENSLLIVPGGNLRRRPGIRREK
ncbi:MAG: hypothetical protein P8X85_23965 [Desulfobacterales bacterium]